MIKCHIRRRTDTLTGEGPTMFSALNDAERSVSNAPDPVWHFNFFDAVAGASLFNVEIEAPSLEDACHKLRKEVFGAQ